jgi:hypothetical protein
MNNAAPFCDTKLSLLAQAQRDYNPALVAIEHSAVNVMSVGDNKLSLMSASLPGYSAEEAAARIIAMNSLNYMFFSPTDEGLRRYEFGGKVGAEGMRIAFTAVWGPGHTPEALRTALKNWGEPRIKELFGDISLPWLRGRMLGEVLEGDRVEQAATLLVEAAKTGRLTADDAHELARRFPQAYGKDIYLKRAQLAVIEFAGYLADEGCPVALDVTVAADYQLPRVMRALGVLRYSPELALRVDTFGLIDKGTAEERAIRSATILGAKAMADHLSIPEAYVDNVLWYSRKNVSTSVPFHLTETTDY